MSLYRDHILTEAVSSKEHAEKKARYDVRTQLNSQFYSSFYADVVAPERLHKFIIGRKRENIRRIAQDCPKVQFKFLKDQSKIQVVGPTEDVRRAAEALQNNIMDLLRWSMRPEE